MLTSTQAKTPFFSLYLHGMLLHPKECTRARSFTFFFVRRRSNGFLLKRKQSDRLVSGAMQTLVWVFATIVVTAPAVSQAVTISQSLTDFTVMSGSDRFRVVGKGGHASLSSLTQLLVAESVTLEVVEIATKRSSRFECRSFSYELDGGYTVCEIDSNNKESPKTVTIDLEQSEMSYF